MRSNNLARCISVIHVGEHQIFTLGTVKIWCNCSLRITARITALMHELNH